MEYGKIKFEGSITEALEIYQLESFFENETIFNGTKIIKKVLLHTLNGVIKYNGNFNLEVYFEAKNSITNLVLGIVIKDLNDVELIGVNNRHYHQEKINSSSVVIGSITVFIEKFKLLPGAYKIDLYLGDSITDIEIIYEAIKFTVSQNFENKIVNSLNMSLNKVFHESVVWKFNNVNE